MMMVVMTVSARHDDDAGPLVIAIISAILAVMVMVVMMVVELGKLDISVC